MDQNLEVFFCDLCNTSVPQRDLDTGVAVKIKGRVLGSCCVSELRGSPAGGGRERSGSGAMGVAGALVLLVAVASSAAFLDWRLSDEAQRLQGRMKGLELDTAAQRDRVRSLEERIGTLAAASDVGKVRGQVGELAATLSASMERISQSAAKGTASKIDLLRGEVGALGDAQARQTDGLRSIREEVRGLSAELATAMARPRAAPTEAVMPDDIATEDPPSAEPGPADGLPAALAHHVQKLEDPDPGTRFEAVDKLVESKNPAVLPALLKAATDADLFVRRLTLAGLVSFKDARSVDSLITALADPEEIVRQTAVESLKNLTNQDIEYDPFTKRVEDRRRGQQRWQDWWRDHRGRFAPE